MELVIYFATLITLVLVVFVILLLFFPKYLPTKRKWEYYEDTFGTGEEQVEIHLRICQITDIIQIYDLEKEKYVDYLE